MSSMHRPPPRHQMIPTERGTTSLYTWDGIPGAPTVLLLHATGFHARVWDAVVDALPTDYTILAPDLRGHGRSPHRAPEPRWQAFADDIVSLLDHLGLKNAIGVGHSMGGYCLAYAAFDRLDAFRHLVLVDPVISEPRVYELEQAASPIDVTAHPVARRRNNWASWQEFMESLAPRSPFDLWRPRVLEDYCRNGLLPKSDGDGFELACPPLVEATIYINRRYANLQNRIPGIAAPATVLRARYEPFDPLAPIDFRRSPTWPNLAAHLPNGRDVYLPNLTHFIPMQEPELVAQQIRDAIGEYP